MPCQQFDHLLALTREGVYGLDTNGCITFINPAACRILEWTPEEALGKSAQQLFHHSHADGRPRSSAETLVLNGKAPQSWVMSVEDTIWARSGESVAVELSAAPIIDNGIVTGSIVTFRDARERHLNQQALLRHFAEMKALSERLEQAHQQLMQSEKLASIGQLAAGVAHEINNPIGFIQSNMGALARHIEILRGLIDVHAETAAETPCPVCAKRQRLKQDLDYDYVRADVDDLLKESSAGLERVRRIVQNLREFAREGTADDWTWVDLAECLRNTLTLTRDRLIAKSTVQVDLPTLPEVWCQPAQINQVFLNLLLNAAQAIKEHGEITVKCGISDDEVWFEITDNGEGISSENLSKIYEPFFTTRPVGQGTGLGLTLAWSIVRQHQGRFEVRSQPQQGTTMRMILPIDPRQHPR